MLRLMSLPISIMKNLIGGSMNFSLEEQKVGTWIDGKPLYQITIEGTTSNLKSTAPVHEGTLENLNIKQVYGIDGVVITNGNSVQHINYCNAAQQSIQIYYNGSAKQIDCYNYSVANMSNQKCYVTIWYTKTTD